MEWGAILAPGGPADAYFGRAQDLLAGRQKVLANAYRDHPERFPKGCPKPAALPEAVYINPPLVEGLQPGGAH